MSFKGKAIYNPSGKAGEYSYWACNFYNGCSNGCTYCYCKKGLLARTMGGDQPTLKKCFRDEDHALELFEKELMHNLPELREHGIFLSFTTDPMLRDTIAMTLYAVVECLINQVPVKILTKRADFLDFDIFQKRIKPLGAEWRKMVAFGFTLTGHDELEPGASTNAERIEAMRKLHDAGFRTFASIEPVIDLQVSYDMVLATLGFCDLYKIGLLSGRKYDKDDLHGFLSLTQTMACYAYGRKVYFKDSILKQAGIERATLPANCVQRDYNMFKNE